ncbi:MAG: choice-of-anchor I family protein [Cyanobacteriota bacterium]|nr:choice-of-anchor I family protein [Cyanobacteriota bacterium]
MNSETGLETRSAKLPTNLNFLRPLGTYETGIFNESAAEIPAYDPKSKRVFIAKGTGAEVDVLDISDPENPTLDFTIDLSQYGGGVNSVAVNEDGVVALAVEKEVKQKGGSVVFFNRNGTFLSQVKVGSLPDMLTFTPDGEKVLVANEGEPTDNYQSDPRGTISIIDISDGAKNVTQQDVRTANFADFNPRKQELIAKGVRIFGPGGNVPRDLEPEYIAVSPDGETAFATLQENNAFAVIDIESAEVTDILPLGYKDHSRGPTTLSKFNFRPRQLPILGTTEAGQEIKLGGFSGLSYEGTDEETGNLKFVTVPDRGPNGAPTDVDEDGDEERPFVLPDYQARVVRFELNENNGRIANISEVLLTQQDGTTPITGLPNIEGIDEVPVDLSGNALTYDPFGADLEGIVINEDGSFLMVDEYRPSIYKFDAQGVLIDRFVPEGTAELAGQAEGTFGTETLPAEYANRRPNRGFEAVALDTDNEILYSFIQTPLANPDRQTSDNSNVIRILGIDPQDGTPMKEYVYLLEGSTFGDGKVDKIGDAVYAGDGKFLVTERDSSTSEAAKKFIFEIDLKDATNLLDDNAPTVPNNSTLEQLTANDLKQRGIQPVDKIKVTNLPSIGYSGLDKPEGLTVLEDGRIAVLNDNDFGLLDEEIPVDGTVPLNPDPTPISLGLIEFAEGNTLDASNEDDGINLENWPVFGMYQPDAIESFPIDGKTYYITANEGDARDYEGFSEEARVGDVEIELDPDVFPDATELKAEDALGRLKITNTKGDIDGDGKFDRLYAFGGRSFSIWDEFGNLVYDSSDDFEKLTAELFPDNFNSDNDDNDSFDSRSDDKGPEPEGVAVGEVDGITYAFIGLERVGGIMVYNITNPKKPKFVEYFNNREFDGDASEGTAGDLGPEGLTFIPAEDSPDGRALLVAANEVSGTTTIYQVSKTRQVEGSNDPDTIEGSVDEGRVNGGGGDDRISGGGGRDTLIGGNGDDNINGNRGSDRLFGQNGNDTLNGGWGNDRVIGGNGKDTVIGHRGNDRLFGNNGRDVLDGRTGRDFLNGGSGNDTLTGGVSEDTFIFASNKKFSNANLGIDRITDFELGEDRILLDLTTFTALESGPGGNIAPGDFATVTNNNAARSSDAAIVYNSATGRLLYNANGSDPGFGAGGQFAIIGRNLDDLGVEDFSIKS